MFVSSGNALLSLNVNEWEAYIGSECLGWYVYRMEALASGSTSQHLGLANY